LVCVFRSVMSFVFVLTKVESVFIDSILSATACCPWPAFMSALVALSEVVCAF
jgi:hypothetical protein